MILSQFTIKTNPMPCIICSEYRALQSLYRNSHLYYVVYDYFVGECYVTNWSFMCLPYISEFIVEYCANLLLLTEVHELFPFLQLTIR